ncbi:hypothetical protein AAC03nite_39380 [Alicyclobacillus acidoterrestris]|nr:hypothetical protein AAC03nite_39380 [Alicyclobacillus acidoterrestris]
MDFHRFVSLNCQELLYYNESSSPRTKLMDQVYTSTEYPSDQRILLHNELSYSATWPQKIWFFCEKAAEQGGETPIADVRRVHNRIDPEIRERFLHKGWMLVRNFNDGFGLTWQEAFHTENPAVVEAYCREQDIEVEWKEGGRLRTRQVRKAIRCHPITGEPIWFNHMAFWHERAYQPEIRSMMLQVLGCENLPYSTYHGDGSPIEDDVVDHILQAYEVETEMFPWHEGDLLMLDNMLVAHARSAFVGTRRVLVTMGEPFSG